MVYTEKNIRQILKYTPLLLFNLLFFVICLVIYSNSRHYAYLRIWHFILQFYIPSMLVMVIFQNYLVNTLFEKDFKLNKFLFRLSLLLLFGLGLTTIISQYHLTTLGKASSFISGLFWLVLTFLGLLLSSTSSLTEYWYRQKLDTVTNEAERVKSELILLKSQINPHFLFNTLNNIYGLVYMKDERAPKVIGKLSQLLRYLLYDCSTPRVSLIKEKEMLSQYLSLQSLKSKSIAQRIDFYSDGIENQHQIMPMLLINFVENCFKHSNIESSNNAWIKISLEVEENELVFQTQNTIEASGLTENTTGIGLTNTLKLLEAGYAENYTLNKSLQGDVFELRLNIQLI